MPHRGIDLEHQRHPYRVDFGLHTVHERPQVKAPLVIDEPQPLRRRVQIRRVVVVGIVRCHEFGEDHDQIEYPQNRQGSHGELVAQEAPGHELPLGRDDVPLVTSLMRLATAARFSHGHPRYTAPRILGSRNASRISESRVPSTVSTLRTKTMLPARNMS